MAPPALSANSSSNTSLSTTPTPTYAGRWRAATRTSLSACAARSRDNTPAAADIPLVIANSKDRDSLDAMTARAEVICTTVGPYAKYGVDLVASCVEAGTDYCDLTGEVQFVRQMIDAHHERAGETGARIVHFCGFDSIPSDLGVLMVQEHALSEHGRPCDRIKFVLQRAKGGFSGGTIDSMINLFEEMGKNSSLRKLLGNPYALNPEGERKGPDGGDQVRPRYDEQVGAWTGPFIMAAANTRVVRRSNALKDYAYGRDFRYSEVMGMGDGPTGMVRAGLLSAGLGGLTGALAIGPTRRLLQNTVLPEPGEGPSRESIEEGYFIVELFGSFAHSERTVHAKVRGERDPGYGATATMIAESAICLALQGNQLSSPGGILTPASAMGAPLVDRLRDAGMTFEVRG